VSIRDSDDGTVITVDADQDGKPELTAVDPDKALPEGQVGVYNHSLNGWHRMNLVSIRIELSVNHASDGEVYRK
jgi:hypothetical protein